MAGYYGKNYEKPDDALIESSQEAASTPDYSSSQDNAGNPFYEGNTDTNADIIEDDDDEEKKNEQEAQPETPAVADTEAARTAAAQAQNANLYAAIGQDTQPDPVASMQQAGLDADTISALQQIDKYAHTKSPEEFQRGFATIASQNKAVADLYMQYYVNNVPQSNAPAQQPTPQNQFLPSAGGNYQADSIYDPNKTYGRQPDGSYNYSYSARELQNNLAREGYYKGAIDGYFGQQTQDALNAYLAEHGIKSNNAKNDESYKMYDSPIGPSMPQSGNASSQESTNSSVALAASSAEAPSNVDEALKNYTESIRPDSNQPIDYRAALAALESVNQSPEQTAPTTESTSLPAPTAATEATGEVYGTPQTTSPVNGRHYEGVGNKAQNPDKVAQESNGYTMNTPSAPTEGSAYWDANREPVYSNESPNTNGETSYFRGDETPVDPYVAELERARQIADINARGRSMDTYYREMLDNMQSQPEERQSMTGNSMSAALENYRTNEQARQHYQDNYEFLYNRGGQIKDGVTLGLGKIYWNDAKPTSNDQYYENLYRRGDTPKTLYQRNEGEDNAYANAQDYERWLADRGLTDYGPGVAESWRHGGKMNISENSPGTRSGAFAEANRPEVHYGDTRSTTFEDAEQLALYDELENLYRNSVASPYSDTNIDNAIPGARGLGGRPAKINSSFDSNPDTIASDDIQSSGSPNAPIEYSDAFILQEKMKDSYSPYQSYNDNYMSNLERQQRERESHYGDSMSRALADNQAQPNTNIFAQDAPPVVSPQREEQYKTLFGNEIAALKQMYPDASYNQLYDYLRLFYEQNGDTDTEYYRWFNSFL